MKLEKDAVFSHYRILSAIGKGGMGEVYLAQDTKLNRKVAIKFLSDEFSKDSEKLNRFIQEAQATSALNHPNILTIHEIDDFKGTHYIAAEFIEGETLRDLVSREDSLPLNRILKISIQITEALVAAHATGITHRDIKPENIMIRKDGYVKVLDFGLAKLAEEKGSKNVSLEGETKALVKTNPGVVMGTASYMSPEQARGKETDERTDIWSVGVVLYEMLAGKVPFAGETVNHTIVAILENEPLDLENVPNALQRIVRKALTKDKEMRYQTAKDLLIDLKNLRKEMDLQGELERSVIPNREGIKESIGENETRAYAPGSVEETNAASEGLKTQDEAKVTNASSLEYAVNQARHNKLVSAVIGFLLLSVLATMAYFVFRGGRQEVINSIAVMPFVNESGDPEVEYLSDGMTEDLISSLTEIPDLSVKARSTVFYYKGKNLSPKQIGEELSVEAVLLGRVVQRGDSLKLNLELVDTFTLDAIWSKSYDRKMNDLVDLQSEIARNVSVRLRSVLSSEEQLEVAKTRTKNSEAQQLYLKGRFYWNKRTIEDFEKAEDHFRQAIDKDPAYALAYSGLADTYTLMPYFGEFRSKEYFPKAEKAISKALELDPELAEAHASRGLLLSYQFEFDAADRALRKAIDLNPEYAAAHHWYAENLLYIGKFEEALKEIDTALKLEPLSLIINLSKGYILNGADRNDEAIVQCKKTVELFPNVALTHYNLSSYYANDGSYEKAAEHIFTGMEVANDKPERIQNIKNAYKKSGWKGILQYRLEKELEFRKRILNENKSAYLKNIYLVWTYAGLGDKEKTLEYLNKAFEERDPSLVDIRNDYTLDFLHGDPRFEELIRKVGFPEDK